MQVELVHGADAVNTDAWAHITQDHSFAGLQWCRYGEAVLKTKAHYVIVHHEGEPIGGALLWVIDRDDFPIDNKWVRRLFDWFVARRPMIVARTAIRTDFKGIFLPDNPALAAQVLAEIRTVAKQLMAQYNGSFFVADYLHDHELDLDWGDFIALPNLLEVGTKLELPYETYEEYLLETKARKKRNWKTIKHNTRKAHERGLSVVIEDTPPDRERMIEMLHLQRAKYDANNPQSYDEEVFDVAHLAENMRWIKIFQEGELVGAELAFWCSQTGVYYPGLFGRDDVDYVYFLAYYNAIQFAIEETNVKTMIGNSGTEHLKVRLGFIADKRNNMIFYPANGIMRFIAEAMVRVLYAQPDVSTATPPEELEPVENPKQKKQKQRELA